MNPPRPPGAATATLGHGRFFGDCRHERRIGALSLAELRPTVPEHEVQTHIHEDAHFLLLLEGRYVSSAAGMPAVCAQPALVLNPPGTTHRDCFRGLDGRFFTLSMPVTRWREATAERGLPERAQRLSASGLIHALRLHRELRAWDDVSPLAVESCLEALFDDAATESRLRDRDAPDWLHRARERLRDDCLRPPRLAELAREADVHPVYFSRAFRRRYRCSPGDYLRRCRLERALPLVCERGIALAEVAAACGFADQAHFCRAFRAAFGCSPLHYRALI